MRDTSSEEVDRRAAEVEERFRRYREAEEYARSRRSVPEQRVRPSA
jgi:hypothetical protein